MYSTSIFFFQAEDGIRDRNVTGVQTCALPIFRTTASIPTSPSTAASALRAHTRASSAACSGLTSAPTLPVATRAQIGRASCRERVEISVVADAAKKKREEGREKREQ